VSTTDAPMSRASDDVPPDDAAAQAPIEIVVVALGAVAVGVVLRFVTRSPLWLDEALSVNIAKLPLGDIAGALRHDGHPPLYYFMLHGWIDLFGTGDVAVRALSGLLAVLALPLAWFVGRRRGGRLLGWLLVGVQALSPFALRYATETRMYALIVVLVLFGYLVVDDVARRGKDGLVRLSGLAVVSGLLLLSHYWAMWLIGAVGLVLLWRWRRGPADARRGALRAALALAAGGLLFLPWLPSFLAQVAHTGTPWAGSQRPTTVVANTLRDFGGGDFRDAEFVGALILILCLLALFARSLDGRHIELDLRTRTRFRSEAVIVALTLGIGIVVMLATNSAYAPRYASVFFPLVALLTAGGLTCFASRPVRATVFASFLALCLLGAYWNVTFQRTQGREAANAINGTAAPGDIVLFCPDQLGPAFSRSLRTDVDRLVYPTLAAPDRVDWVDYASRNRAADPAAVAGEILRRVGEHRVFLVWQGEYRTFEGQCEALYNALASARPTGATIVTTGGKRFFEPASVSVFPARP
jgi:mannosyltransferase